MPGQTNQPQAAQTAAPRLVITLLALLLAGLSLAMPAAAAPAAKAWPRWQINDPQSTHVINHDVWDQLLKNHVHPGRDGINRFNYAGVTALERAEMEGYVAGLEAVNPDILNRAEQRAFWINLYNAVTVRLALAQYPVNSIRDIPGGFLGLGGPWGEKRVTVNGVPLSLDDIEHRILRPLWQDVRLHYAVNCASLGCPDLQPEAFTAANTESLLDRGAAAYVNHPRGVRITGGKLYLSSIYDWFQADFGGSPAGVIRHLKTYAAPALAAQLATTSTVAGYDYDWALNGMLETAILQGRTAAANPDFSLQRLQDMEALQEAVSLYRISPDKLKAVPEASQRNWWLVTPTRQGQAGYSLSVQTKGATAIACLQPPRQPAASVMATPVFLVGLPAEISMLAWQDGCA